MTDDRRGDGVDEDAAERLRVLVDRLAGPPGLAALMRLRGPMVLLPVLELPYVLAARSFAHELAVAGAATTDIEAASFEAVVVHALRLDSGGPILGRARSAVDRIGDAADQPVIDALQAVDFGRSNQRAKAPRSSRAGTPEVS